MRFVAGGKVLGNMNDSNIACVFFFCSFLCVCAQSCPTLCNPMGCSLPGSSVHGILQERILKWVAISSSRGSSSPRDRTGISCVSNFGRWILYYYATWETPNIACCCYVASVVSNSVWAHRRQLLHLWDSPGKNTGVGCHFLLQCMKGKSEREVAQSCLTLCDPMDCSVPSSSIHGIFQAIRPECIAIAFSDYCLSFLFIMYAPIYIIYPYLLPRSM